MCHTWLSQWPHMSCCMCIAKKTNVRNNIPHKSQRKSHVLISQSQLVILFLYLILDYNVLSKLASFILLSTSFCHHLITKCSRIDTSDFCWSCVFRLRNEGRVCAAVWARLAWVRERAPCAGPVGTVAAQNGLWVITGVQAVLCCGKNNRTDAHKRVKRTEGRWSMQEQQQQHHVCQESPELGRVTDWLPGCSST